MLNSTSPTGPSKSDSMEGMAKNLEKGRNFTPSWWSKDVHGTAWDRVKGALRRDWEQTKNDFTPGAPDLNQDVDDTIKQATGAEPIPAPGMQTPPSKEEREELGKKSWSDVEGPLSYGYAARAQYGKDHPTWNPALEGTLKGEWTAKYGNDSWDDVRDHVRTGFNTRF